MNFNFLKDKYLKKLFSLFEKYGEKLYVVGGAIRDTLIGQNISDIDLVTTMPPKKMLEMFEENNIRCNSPGINYGTVHCFFNKDIFEITTLREDTYKKKTIKGKTVFSRYPDVKFIKDINLDAKRRDFTINALYLTQKGEIIDPLNGMEDLKNGIVKFIGNPLNSVAYDPLRILRYFRFCASGFYKNFDEVSLAVCIANFDKIFNLNKRKFADEYNKMMKCRGRFVIFNKWNEFGILEKIETYANTINEEIRIEDAKRKEKERK